MQHLLFCLGPFQALNQSLDELVSIALAAAKEELLGGSAAWGSWNRTGPRPLLLLVTPTRRSWLLAMACPAMLDSLAVDCRFEPAVGGTSEALRVAVLPIREGKCLPGVFATNGQ